MVGALQSFSYFPLSSSEQQQKCDQRLQRRKLTLVEVVETPKLVHGPEITNIAQGGTRFAKMTPIWYALKKMDSYTGDVAKPGASEQQTKQICSSKLLCEI